MKTLVSILGLAALWQVPLALAQLAPVNELGLSLGHLHLAAPDREKEAKAWIALGGQLENNLSGNIPIGFPGVVVLIAQSRPVSAGSAGSLIHQVAFPEPNVDVNLA